MNASQRVIPSGFMALDLSLLHHPQGEQLKYGAVTMIKLVTGSLVALALVAGPALAQTTTPASVTAEAAIAAKFKAADKNGNGVLDGAELDAYKANLAKIDTDKDGKISMAEFTAATKSGLIK
jgi:hypothetical protein